MVKKSIPLIILVGLVSILIAACGGNPEPMPTPFTRTSPSPLPAAPTPSAADVAPETQAPIVSEEGKPVRVELLDADGRGPFAFSPYDLKFSAGETITFTFDAEATFHTFTIDELGIDVSVEADNPETLTFTFDEPGTYQLICIPHELLGMVGTIIVQ